MTNIQNYKVRITVFILSEYGSLLSARNSSLLLNWILCFMKNAKNCVLLQVNAEGRLSAQYITEQLRRLDTTLKKLEKEGRVLEDRIRSGEDPCNSR